MKIRANKKEKIYVKTLTLAVKREREKGQKERKRKKRREKKKGFLALNFTPLAYQVVVAFLQSIPFPAADRLRIAT